MNDENQPSTHFRHRRQVLQGAAAALLSVGMGSRALGAEKSLQVGGLPVTCNLTLPVACMASAMDANLRQGLRPDIRVQQVQRLARDQGIADVGTAEGRLHAGAADHGSRGQCDTGQGRVAGPSLGRGDHGADRFSVQELQGPHAQACCGTQPLRRRLSLPQEDAGEGRHDPQGRRSRRDGPARHAGRSVCESGRRLRDRRTLRGGRAARRLREAASA